VEDVESLPEPARTEALRQATALAGCLMQAAVVTVDQLFEDIEHLRTADGPEDFDIDDSWQLCHLPPRFAVRYTALFGQEFLVALVDVTARFTVGWKPLACVAQEMSLRLLLNGVEVIADSSDVTLPDVGGNIWKRCSLKMSTMNCFMTWLSMESRKTCPCSRLGWRRCGSRTGSFHSTLSGPFRPTRCQLGRAPLIARRLCNAGSGIIGPLAVTDVVYLPSGALEPRLFWRGRKRISASSAMDRRKRISRRSQTG
jgi:hypothetical protein